MVATRRGVRVYSPTKTNSDESSGVQATPSTSRRTRRTAKQAETPAQEEEGSNSQPDGGEGGPPVSPHSQILLKRCSRASRLHSPEQPSTPAGSIHEADVSDVDSCCSAVSDIERPITRSQRRKRQSRLLRQEEDEVSEVESCSSTVSTSKGDSSVSCRGPRTRAARAKAAASIVVSEPQSCDSEGFESGPSKPRRSTRNRGKAKSTAKDSDSEVTDVYSPMGSPCTTRGTGTPCSSRTGSGNSNRAALTTRLSAKVLRVVLESANDPVNREGEGEPTVTAPMEVNSQAGKVTVSEPTEEESVLSDHRLDSTVMTDPDCTVLEDLTLTLEEEEGDEGDKEGVTSTDLRSDNGTPEDTEVIEVGNQGSVKLSMAADVMSETTSMLLSTKTTEAEKGAVIIHEEDEEMNTPADFQASLTHSVVALDSHSQANESQSVGEAAVTVDRQQRELSVRNKNDDTSELQPTQETVLSSESLELPSCQSVKVMCESAAPSEAEGVTKENDKAVAIGDVDNHTNDHPPQTERLQDKHLDRDTNVETLCVEEEEEEMEVGTSNAGDQQVVVLNEVPLSPSEADHKQVEPIQVTSGQEQKVTVEPGSEQEPKDSVVVQKKGIINLLESSEDEDGYVEEDESSGDEEEEEDLGRMEEEKAGPSKKSKVAAASMEGLFMIDTRPGQEADEQYYKEDPSEKAVEQEEQDEEEFVDEEGDEDEDDEDAQMLFFSRNPKSKELSSHIDPGLRVKELGGLYINFDGSKSKPVSSSLKKLKEQKIQDEVMKKSVIGPEFEKNSAAPPYSKSKRTLKLRRKVEREKTTGDGWFNMKAPELTQELKGDLKVLKMRGSLDPKRFYKKNDRDGLPKYFQVGTVVDNPVDFYHSRVPKKQRKRTMVEELLADAEFRHTNKKKYQQIMTEKAAQGAGKLKKNKFYNK